MTTSDYKKVFKQLKEKPVKLKKFLKHNEPKKRATGKNRKRCLLCGNPRGHIGKYGLNLCRRCFRDNATNLGFKKYR
jgi:ribosomal protein S14